MTRTHAGSQMYSAPRTGDAVAGLQLTIGTGKIAPRPEESKAMPTTVTDSDRIPVSRQWLAEAMRNTALLGVLRDLVPPRIMQVAEEKVGAPLTEAHRIAADIAADNPTFSQRTAAVHAGMDICPWCLHVRTPSNPHEGCGPQVAR